MLDDRDKDAREIILLQLVHHACHKSHVVDNSSMFNKAIADDSDTGLFRCDSR